MTDNIGSDATEASTKSTQDPEVRTYTQEEVDAMMAKTRSSVEHKISKRYSGYEELGSLDELRDLRERDEKLRQKKLVEKGEFEKVIQDIASKKDAQIKTLQEEIQGYKINSPLVDTAAKHNAVNPEQVRSLLHDRVRLNDTGEVEVVDEKGSVRYNDDGKPFNVDALVREFLDSNPHFRQATPATTNTRSNTGKTSAGSLDISKLDMTNPEHRELYRKTRKSPGL